MEILSVCALGSTTVETSIEVPHRAASARPEDVKLFKKNFFFSFPWLYSVFLTQEA